MSYGYEKRVSYSECDGVGVLRYDALVDIFQDCSTFQSEDTDYTLAKMLGMHRGWMLSFWQIDIAKMPSLGDNVYVGTFPYSMKGCIGSRNFFLKNEAGDMLAKSNSIWVLMDLEKQQPVKIPDEMATCFEIGGKLDMEYLPRKLKIPDSEVIHTSRFTVERFFLDSNGHMNNAWFVRLGETSLQALRDTSDTAASGNISRICVEYKKQARLGDVIILDTYKAEDGIYINMRNESNISYAIYFCEV